MSVDTSKSSKSSNLTQLQQRIWLGHKLDPGIYSTGGIIRVDRMIDATTMRAAIDYVNRHSQLHQSVFEDVDGVPMRRAADVPVDLIEVDLTEHGDGDAALNVWREELRAETLNLSFETRLQRFVLLKLGEADYALDWVDHHILNDFWSFSTAFEAVSKAYLALESGEAMPTLDIPAFDRIVEKEISFLASEAAAKSQAYWQKEMDDALPPLSLYGVPASAGSGAVKRHTIELDDALSAAIRERVGAAPFKSLSAHQSLFLFVSTVTSAWLHRVTGNERVGIGAFFHNRRSDEDKKAFGPLISAAPLRTDICAEDSFAEVFKRLSRKYRGALRHSAMSPPNRPEARAFDLSVNYVNATFVEFLGSMSELIITHPGRWYQNEPMAMQVWDLQSTGRVVLSFDFDTGVFDADQQQRTIGHFLALVRAAVENPDGELGAVDIVGSAERSTLLDEFGRRERNYPEARVTELISDIAERFPDTPAASLFGAESLSYRELESRSNQLAHELIARGLEREAIVGLCLPPGTDYAVACLAVLKAGAAFLPLDPGYPSDRLQYMVADSNAALVISHSDVAGTLLSDSSESDVLLLLDRAVARLDAQSTAAPDLECSPSDLAYLIYTSGSTGKPKGVLLEHRGLTNMAFAQAEQYRIEPGMRVLNFASFNFDAAVCDLFMTWVSGGTVCFAALEDKAPGARLERLLRDDSINACVLTPSVMAVTGCDELPDLKTIGSAGEACTPDVLQRWAPGRYFVNAYGPTECTVGATSATAQECAQSVTIGRPAGNVEVLLIDANAQLVPIGVTGEIALAGVQLARGYHAREDITAEKFPLHPLRSGQRIYRTGDLARYREDGCLEYLGRSDDQVKVRGIRIELGEIEACIARAAGVRGAVVSLFDPDGGNARLVAYYSGRDDLDATLLRDFARKELPEVMVPSFWVPLSELPMTVNGKVDRQRLPEPNIDHLVTGRRTYVAPVGEMEESLAGLWCELVGVERVGRDDSFFDVGGHSLLATQLAARIESDLGLRVTLRQLFEMPVLSAMAAGLSGKLSAVAGNLAEDLGEDFEEFEI
ncbi:MAG: amino acid adenylation domain-containing protein [Pseudomonadaceae bacterium]|nr:amino acid adenylation domain-containing protein [Pseudomonadaceae bacterium]